MLAKAVPEVFGTRALGAILGVLNLGWRCGAALGPAAAGFLHDVTGSYVIPFGAAPIAVLASWGLFALGSSPRRARAQARTRRECGPQALAGGGPRRPRRANEKPGGDN